MTAHPRLYRIRTAAFCLLLGLALPGSALAHGDKPVIPDAVKALQAGRIYVDYDARPTLSELEADALGRQLAARKRAFVAVLPRSARAELGTDAEGVVVELVKSVGRDGVYIVSVGGEILIAKGGRGLLSTGVAVGPDKSRPGDALATRLAAVANEVPPEREAKGAGQGLTIVLVVAAAAVLALWWRRTRRSRPVRR